jgi:DNA-binding cell septation regulator SpoVG
MSEDRIDKIDDAISRLAIVASDLSKMLAVHEHRIIQQEKNADSIVASIDKRRTEVDNILKDVYSTIRNETNMLRESSTKQHIEQNVKIEAIQKTMWMAVGAATVVSWAAPILLNKFIH